MSRCVRFPPPGFVWNGASGEALVKHLQARKEKVAAEKRSKEVKRKKEKKRKRKEEQKRKKEENEELEEGEIREEKCSKRKKHKKRKKSKKCDDDNKLVLELERSNLTEEHEQPIGDHHSLYDSTDNTENVRPTFAIQKDKFGLAAGISTTPVVEDKAESSLQHIESQYRDLFENNAASFPTQTEHFHDQGWLFESRLPRRSPPAVVTACNENDSYSESSSLYPCLRYLPQAGIYARPYTIWF